MTEQLPKPEEHRAKSGYTLPVFACAAAVAAYQHLNDHPAPEQVIIDLINPPQNVEITIEQVARLSPRQALAISRSEPGDNLDLTAGTPVWAVVELRESPEQNQEPVLICGGEGIGITKAGNPAIYSYAQQLLNTNLVRLLAPEEKIQVTIILPQGKRLAARTSNAAFGVLEGLSLLGTSGISQPLSSPDQLAAFQADLAQKSISVASGAGSRRTLVFCIGENGLDLAPKIGIDPKYLVKTANWLGSMLVAAAAYGVEQVLLFGYHGKLIKLAGGIFHTHHHLADGRLEILTALAVQVGLPIDYLQQLYQAPTTDAALGSLRDWDQANGGNWVEQIYGLMVQQIDRKAQDYIHAHTEKHLTVGTIVFDRQRQIIITSDNGKKLLPQVQSEQLK